MRFGRAMWLSLFPCLHLCRWKGILGHDFGGRKLIGNGLNVTSRWCLLKESRAVSDDVLTRDSVGINSFVELSSAIYFSAIYTSRPPNQSSHTIQSRDFG